MRYIKLLLLALLVGISSCSSKNTTTSNTSVTVNSSTKLNCNRILLKKTDSRNSLYEYCKKQKKHEASGYFYIGGFFGSSYYVKIKNHMLSYSEVNRGIKKSSNLVLTSHDLFELEKRFKSLGVEDWKENYENSNVTDGTHWLFKYNSRDVVLNSTGSNSFPRNFSKVTEYISKVLLKGKKFN